MREGAIDEPARAEIDAQALARVEAAVEFADSSPFPAPDSLYDDVYVLDDAVRGSYSVRTTAAETPDAVELAADGAGAAADGAERDEIPRQITDALQVSEDAS